MKHPMTQALAVLGLATALSAAATAREPSIRIDTHRMDVTNRDSMSRLYAQIQSSARKVCVDATSSSDSDPIGAFDQCYAATVAIAVRSAGVPLLTSLHGEASRAKPLRQARK
jgi:UrcA family protein